MESQVIGMEDASEQNVLSAVRAVRHLEKRLEEVFILLILLVGFYQLFNECKNAVASFEFVITQFLWILYWIPLTHELTIPSKL